MLIEKITTGFVIQTFDTENQKFIIQSFVAGGSEYEIDGAPLTPDQELVAGMVNFGPLAEVEAYLPFEMVQPK